MKKVLILEDQRTAREALVSMIEQMAEKVEIFCAGNLNEAFSETLQSTIDVFLIDIILEPGKPGDVSGMVFAEKIREVEKYAFTPIIFITSLQDLELFSYRNIHCFGYIEKPFSRAEVAKLVRSALRYETPRETGRVVYFRKEGILLACHIEEIVCATVSGHTMSLHMKDRKLEIPYISCGQLLRKLDCRAFVQCARNTIINKEFILNVDFTNRMIKLRYFEGSVTIGVTFMKKLEKELK